MLADLMEKVLFSCFTAYWRQNTDGTIEMTGVQKNFHTKFTCNKM